MGSDKLCVSPGVRDIAWRAQGICRSVTATDSVAAPRSKAAPETLRASTRTVLFVRVQASSSCEAHVHRRALTAAR